ncbi:MAG: hypothetical protein N3B12_06665 [Armatimonadetes bacterium]|nr:hypothetical protein [Armatimonadota bacterium]
MELERISYDEARTWFWMRTWLWFVVCAVFSVVLFFEYSGGMLKTLEARFWVSAIAGISTALMGLSAAAISRQFAWMRIGWRLGFVLNGPVCALISGLMAVLAGNVILSFMQNDPTRAPSATMLQVVYSLLQFGAVEAALWGFIFGSWFAMRRDKYFVEPI